MSKKRKILITSPSTDNKDNVSGISNLTRLLIENNNIVDYKLFVVGKKDNEDRGLKWLIKKPLLISSFVRCLLLDDISLIHINIPLEKYSSIVNSVLAFLCYFFRKPYIMHIRGGRYSKNYNIPLFHKYLIKKSLMHSECILTLGEEEREYICNYYNINKCKVIYLPNSVQIPNIDVDKIKKDEILQILFLGRIDKNKGLIEIIDALKQFKTEFEFDFNIAGEGPDKDWFLESIINEGIDFKYHGIVSGDEKSTLISNSHIFLLPSYFEGLPNALLEAMSYGVIPITTPVGSVTEVVKDKFNGLLVSVNNTIEIVNALTFIINNEKYRTYLSLNAHNSIKSNYSLTDYIDKLNEIYKRVCK
ncbi:MAG: glycosyltransferase family 4 protein [Candidatus Margulisbacteria bacterium]|nr:glycosyltransferase family 4 protein [Candidatus Margulisiibacteriota bacterium]